MGHQYSRKRFFRDAPPALLAQYFERKGISVEKGFEGKGEAGVDLLDGVMLRLPEEQRNEIEQEFAEIDGLACEGGIQAILDDATWYGELDELVRELDKHRSFHAKAFWIFLERHKYWIAATAFFHADSINTRYWRKRINLPRSPARVDPESIALLEANLVHFFHDKEGRGSNCKVDCYKRGRLDYFFAYPEDYPQNRMVWTHRELKRQPETPAFEIIFIFDPEEGTLELYLEGARKIIPDLQAIFAGAILAFELTEDDKDNRVYDLSPVKSRDVQFHYSPDSGIISVAVKKLRLKLVSTGRRITLEADPTYNPLAVYEMLADLQKSFPAVAMVVTQVGIVVTFASSPNRHKPRTRTFDVSWPNSCSLRYDGNDKVIRQMLVDSGLEPRVPGS